MDLETGERQSCRIMLFVELLNLGKTVARVVPGNWSSQRRVSLFLLIRKHEVFMGDPLRLLRTAISDSQSNFSEQSACVCSHSSARREADPAKKNSGVEVDPRVKRMRLLFR